MIKQNSLTILFNKLIQTISNNSLLVYFSKQLNMFIFSKLLIFYNTYFVVKEPIFDNTQPSKSFIKRFFRWFFFDAMFDLIPHSVNGHIYDFYFLSKVISSSLIGRMWIRSKYKFVDESDYISIMKSANFEVVQTNIQIKDLFNKFIDDYIGYGLITKNDFSNYIIDTRYLRQFETRDEYSHLDVIIYLDNDLHFNYCIINGNFKELRNDDFALRECITAISTIKTIEKHLFNVHFFLSDQFNILLNTISDKKNPIYRILIPITNNPYEVNDSASISLLGQTGICTWFNFTRKGLKQYYDYAKTNFNIRDFLIPKKLNGKSSIHQHQHLWYNCIHTFVYEFMNIQDKQFLSQSDDFIDLLKKTYIGIYDDKKDKLTNIIDICTMMIYMNVIHETYSNSKSSKLYTNPFTLSTSWKQNDSNKLVDKINNLGEQTLVNFVTYVTSLEAIRLNDIQWIDRCCINEKEKEIYQNFFKAISDLATQIPIDAVLYPTNISSSVSF